MVLVVEQELHTWEASALSLGHTQVNHVLSHGATHLVLVTLHSEIKSIHIVRNGCGLPPDEQGLEL